jgi:hypothetical protein
MKNEIYPSHLNNKNKGLCSPFFYLHGQAEQLAGYDCFESSADLFENFIRPSVSEAIMKINKVIYNLIVFCAYDETDRRMRGYAVLNTDAAAIIQAIDRFPESIKRCDIEDFITCPETLETVQKHLFSLKAHLYKTQV